MFPYTFDDMVADAGIESPVATLNYINTPGHSSPSTLNYRTCRFHSAHNRLRQKGCQ